MTDRIVALLVANGLMLVLGVGLLPLLRLARTRRELLMRLPLAYAAGLAATGIIVADLAVVDVPVGRVGLPLIAAGFLLVGLRRLERGEMSRAPRLRVLQLPSLALLGVCCVFLVAFARLFAVKPLFESDAWAMWALRGRALYDFGHPTGPVFTSTLYSGLQYPLWLPGLEALDFRLLGRFDGTMANAQLFGIALALVGGGWLLLRRHAPSMLLAGTLLAIITAPAFFDQLETGFADIPLAVMTAIGIAALAAWLRSGDAGLLPAASLFLGAASLTKDEGELFVLAAFVAALVVARTGQRRPLVYAALAVLAVDLPWRIWLQINHVKLQDYSLANFLNIRYLEHATWRIDPAIRELWVQIWRPPSWSYLHLAIVAGIVAAVLLRRVRLALFATLWLSLSFGGLVAIYWISVRPISDHLYNSAQRTIDTLVIGGALLVPVLIGRTPSRSSAADARPSIPRRPRANRSMLPWK